MFHNENETCDSIFILAAKVLRQGGIIAYPTEAVYGIGCDPFNERAVMKLLALKKREVSKGLILIASSWQQVEKLIDCSTVSVATLAELKTSWPKATTFIFPASSNVPKWITGEHNSVAIRITSHEIAKVICECFGNPIVSTSANIANNPPAKNYDDLLQEFGDEVFDLILRGNVGELTKPTPIIDVLTGEALR